MPPNQFAHVMSVTPGMLLIVSAWLVGMLKIIDVERIVTSRVAELASATASKPSSTARSAANKNTAMATLNTVSAVRRLLRRALFRIRPANFITSPRQTGLFDQRTFFEMQHVRRAFGGVRVVRDHHDRFSVLAVQLLQQRQN